MAGGRQAVPLTDFQSVLLATLTAAPNDDRYLAGGAALHFSPTSARYSDDLDFFHDTEARVAAVGKDPGAHTALDAAASFARERPPEECGCLYYSTREHSFVLPRADISLAEQAIQLHFGAPGGVLPRLADARIEKLE